MGWHGWYSKVLGLLPGFSHTYSNPRPVFGFLESQKSEKMVERWKDVME
jgi:hypothetical protein